MSFDSSKDVLVDSLGKIPFGGKEDHNIMVEIRAYKGSKPKLSLVRVMGEKVGKLGRLEAKEALSLLEIMKNSESKIRFFLEEENERA